MIRRVLKVDDSVQLDCYRIANSSVGDADIVYYTIREQVNNDGYVLLVFEDNSGMRGFVLGHQEYNLGHVDRLYVDKRYQRQGIGTTLLEAYEDYAKEYGANRVILCSRASVQAKNFYNKNGYQRIAKNRFMGKNL